MVVHTYNASTSMGKQKLEGSHEFQPSTVLYESSRLASATQLKPVSKK